MEYEPGLVEAGRKPVRRQEQMFEYILRNGSMSAKDLAELFGVSLMTVHRDLDGLEQQGLVRKLRGRVTAQPTSLFESSVSYRMRVASREKEALSQHALSLIEPGQSVMLEDSTTTLPLVKALHEKAPLTVITNFRVASNELSEAPSVNVISLGGEYSRAYDAYFGMVCEAAIASLSADVCFVSTSVALGDVLYHQYQNSVKVKQAIMSVCQRRVLLLDHTKFGKSALHRLGSFEDFDLVLVDSGVDTALLGDLHQSSVPVEVVKI